MGAPYGQGRAGQAASCIALLGAVLEGWGTGRGSSQVPGSTWSLTGPETFPEAVPLLPPNSLSQEQRLGVRASAGRAGIGPRRPAGLGLGGLSVPDTGAASVRALLFIPGEAAEVCYPDLLRLLSGVTSGIGRALKHWSTSPRRW